MSDQHRKELPAFKSEGEEAQWWFDNREALGDEFVQAINEGRVTKGAMVARGLIRTPSIQIDPEDLSRAKVLAEKKGVRYQTYLQVLIHDALDREAKMAG
jgi:hypothetical protein